MKEESENEKKKLMIPSPTSDRDDYIQGIGKKEVGIIVAAIIIGIFVIAIGAISGNVVVFTFIAFFSIAVVIMVVRRDAINETIIDKVKNLIRYGKSQKIYMYEYHEVWKADDWGQDE